MSTNQEKLNEQLFNVIADEKASDEVRLKKVKYLVRLGADVNAKDENGNTPLIQATINGKLGAVKCLAECGADVNVKFFGKSVLSLVKKGEEVAPEIIEFLKEKGAKEVEISKEEADRLAQGFWDKNGKIKSVEEIKSLVKCGASLGAHKKNTNEQIWKVLGIDEINEVLKILPNWYEIDGDVNFMNNNLKKLPDFSKIKVRGDFICSFNELITLAGAPSKVGGIFDCSFNQLITLEGGPSEVGSFFVCRHNQLTTLEGAPVKVGRLFDCRDNQLTTLEGAPSKVGGIFDCSFNQLTTLKGAPVKVGRLFDCRDNQLTTLEGGPSEVGGDFECSHNRLISLEGKPQKIGGEFKIEKEVLDKIRSKETKSFGDIWGRLFGGR